MGLLLLSVVVASQPEAFQPHHQELLRLLNETLGEVGSPGLLFYSLRTLTTMAPYLRTDDVVRCGPSPPLAPYPGAFSSLPCGTQRCFGFLSSLFFLIAVGAWGWLGLAGMPGPLLRVQAVRKLPDSGA